MAIEVPKNEEISEEVKDGKKSVLLSVGEEKIEGV